MHENHSTTAFASSRRTFDNMQFRPTLYSEVHLDAEADSVVEDPYNVIRRLTDDNAALLETVAKQKKQIAERDSTISRLKAQHKATAEHVRTAFATATAYVEAELPKQLEPVLAELRRLQDAEWLREIGDVDPKDAN